MPKFKFNKLVRDKIVDNQIKSGAKPKFRKLDEKEHKVELIKKIIEEAKEIPQSPREDVASEMADVQQALDDLLNKYDLTKEDIAKAQAKKNEKNGAFKEGLFIDWVEVLENDPWTEYYRSNPDRYPEITD